MSKSAIHLMVDSGPKQGETLDRKPGTLIRIGRVVKGNTLTIKESSISQKHLTIEFDAQISGWVLRDLDTSNGTFVNGDRVPLSAAVHLSDGDSVKIGECTSISVKISVIEENSGGVRRNGAKRGKTKSKKEDDDCEEIGGRNCERVSTKFEILDRPEEVPEDLKRGRKRNTKRGLRKDETLGSTLDDVVEEIRKQNKVEEVEEIRKLNCESVKDDKLDSVHVDAAKEIPKNSGKGRKRNPSSGSNKDRTLESASDDIIQVMENSGRIEGTLNKDEVSEMVGKDGMTAHENLVRRRREKTAKVSISDGGVEENINVPKNLGRGKMTASTQILEREIILDSIAVDKTEQHRNLRKQRRQNSASVSIDGKNSEPVAESSVKSLTDLRREKSNLVLVSNKDEALEDNIEEPKAMVRQRRTRSTKVSETDDILNLVPEVKIQELKNEARRRRTSSSRVSTLDETLDRVMEEISEVPKKLGRGKRRADAKVLKIDERSEVVVQYADEEAKNVGRGKPKNVNRGRSASSSKVSTLDEALDPVIEDVSEVPKKLGRGKRRENSKASELDVISEVVMHDAVEEVKNGGRGNQGRAPARRIRASSRVSRDEKLLHSAQDPVLNSVDNMYPSKEQRGGSTLLSEAENIQLYSNGKKSENREDKENYVSVKCQKTENRRDLLKVWNGNGIPNTTTKYMEDQQVGWHATPFEERLEKALSDDKLFPPR